MARVFLYSDLSPARPWLFATVHAARALLAAHGIELGPLNPCACERIPTHASFWRPLREDAAVPPPLLKAVQALRAQLDAGHDVLLMGCSLNPAGHRSLARVLRAQLDPGAHEAHCLFVVGRPACVLEQRCRGFFAPVPDDVGQAIAGRCAALSLLLKEAICEWGADHVALLADVSASPVAERREDLPRLLFTALGCPPPRVPEHLPMQRLFLDSPEGRRLCHAPEVRENAWPALDEGLFMDCLRAAERHWDAPPVSPLALRKRLIRDGAEDLRELERMLGLEACALACPDWLASAPEAAPESLFDRPLCAEKLGGFAAALPSTVRDALRRRYAYDAPLCGPDQKALDRALASGAGATRIGDARAPVELTVLTMTHNHAAYIAECMDSVLAQQTGFPLRHIVLDHCSTDGTAAIVAAYAAKHPSIRPVLLSQLRAGENVTGLFLRCRTKYAALCDGDDYFLDPRKLQKQVDFLESRPHCALCFHPVAVVYENGDPPGLFPHPSLLPRGIREEYHLADLFRRNIIQTNSVLYRWRFQDGLPDWFRPDLCPGDWYWHLLHAETGRIGFLREVMSAYRRHAHALYAASFAAPVEHRRLYGMAELDTYQAVNEHFQRRYFARLAVLAGGVFANFLEISTNEGDDSLLRTACARFPDFARHFLRELNGVQRKNSGRNADHKGTEDEGSGSASAAPAAGNPTGLQL